MNNKNLFTIETENGEKINCELVLSFYLKDKDKNYMLFTDHTYDEDNNLNVYVYYNTSTNEELIPVTDEEEFNTINKIYEQAIKEVNS